MRLNSVINLWLMIGFIDFMLEEVAATTCSSDSDCPLDGERCGGGGNCQCGSSATCCDTPPCQKDTCNSGTCGCGTQSPCDVQYPTKSDSCVSKTCMCGTNPLCSGKNPLCSSGNCKCGTTVTCSVNSDACVGSQCKCGSDEPCSGTSDTCDSGVCLCGSSQPCSVPGETCDSGKCKCGTSESCSGLTSGAYCDASNNVCKCSATVPACSGSTPTCSDGVCVGDLVTLLEDIMEDPTTAASTTAIVLALAAASTPLALFPPSGVPQPGGGGGSSGSGATVASIASVPGLAAEVSSLVAGIDGAVALSVFSSSVEGTFVIPRSIPATAVLIAEAPIIAVSRESLSDRMTPAAHRQQFCPRPVIPLGRKIKVAENKITPVLSRFSKILTPISNIQSKISDLINSVIKRLRLQCLLPKIIRPFEPILKYSKCLLGLNEDEFMETPPCNEAACLDPILEDKPITRDRGVPNLDFMIDGEISTIDDCFSDMEKVVYGSRIRAKLVDDASCDDPKYEEECQNLMVNDRIVMEDDCETPGCTDPNDDPYTACFGCDSDNANKVERGTHRYEYVQPSFNYIDRQTGEMFQTTRQSRRVICARGQQGQTRRRCRLRIDKAMQFRRITYGRAIQFIQSEQYLENSDFDPI